MIHPFAHYNTATIVSRAARERTDLIHKPITDFAAYLHGRNGASTRSAESEPGDTTPLAPKATTKTSPRQRNESQSPEQSGNHPTPPRTRDNPTPQIEPPPDPDGWVEAQGPGPLRYANVPDTAKYPAGPYRRAPEPFGGEWWLVNPFTGDEPWNALAMPTDPTPPASPYDPANLPEGFVDAFGEKPVRRLGEEAIDFVGRLGRWKQDLQNFRHTGTPEGFTEDQVEAVSDNYEQWGLGRPVFYEGRYGWYARFPESALPEFEIDARSAVESSHLAIARYQVRLMQKGIQPDATHPLVPPRLVTNA